MTTVFIDTDIRLPDLYEGHASMALHQAFQDALDAYEDWGAGMAEPIVIFEGRMIPISAIFDHMRSCTDILPARMMGPILDNLTKPWPGTGSIDAMTYQTAARIMRILVARKRRDGAPGHVSALAQGDNDMDRGRNFS